MDLTKSIRSLGDSIGEAIDAISKVKISRNARALAPMERTIARTVFEETIPYSRITVTDGTGLQGRPYTTPDSLTSRRYVLHLGNGYHRSSLSRLQDKKLLIHELTHVWQGEHSPWSWVYVFSSAWHQVAGSAYAYDLKHLKNWNNYNPEQQAQIVEDWFGGGMKQHDPRYHFIVENIRGRRMAK